MLLIIYKFLVLFGLLDVFKESVYRKESLFFPSFFFFLFLTQTNQWFPITVFCWLGVGLFHPLASVFPSFLILSISILSLFLMNFRHIFTVAATIEVVGVSDIAHFIKTTCYIYFFTFVYLKNEFQPVLCWYIFWLTPKNIFFFFAIETPTVLSYLRKSFIYFSICTLIILSFLVGESVGLKSIINLI